MLFKALNRRYNQDKNITQMLIKNVANIILYVKIYAIK